MKTSSTGFSFIECLISLLLLSTMLYEFQMMKFASFQQKTMHHVSKAK